jgi:hypothetical protein
MTARTKPDNIKPILFCISKVVMTFGFLSAVKEIFVQWLRFLARSATAITLRNWRTLLWSIQDTLSANVGEREGAVFSATRIEEFKRERFCFFAFIANSGRNFVKHVTSLEGCMNSGPMSIDSAFSSDYF